MALDRAVLGKMASAQMEALEEDYGENENVEIGGVFTIVEVLTRTGDGNVTSTIRKRHNLGDPFRAVGIMRVAEQQILQTYSAGD
jgi:hypothetical protein